MAWFRRSSRTPSEQSPASGQGPTPDPAGGRRRGPLVAVTALDGLCAGLSDHLPLRGELLRVIPGPDRPDYALMLLDEPVVVPLPAGLDPARVPAEARAAGPDGPRLVCHALVICSRFVGEQLAPDMRDLAINIALVVDGSVLGDEVLDFAKAVPVDLGVLNLAGSAAPAR